MAYKFKRLEVSKLIIDKYGTAENFYQNYLHISKQRFYYLMNSSFDTKRAKTPHKIITLLGVSENEVLEYTKRRRD